jgi:hypothetical protein
MIRDCWLDGDSYRTVLSSQDQQRIFMWHQHYLECRANIWESETNQNAISRIRYALYQSVYAGINPSVSLIESAINNFEINCVGPNSVSDVSATAYRACDPSNGAFSRVFANNAGDPLAFEFTVATCTGTDLQTALITASVEIDFYYRALMRAIGSPEFGGTPGTYTPAYSAILQPVLRMEIQRDGRLDNCTWYSNAYVQAANAFHYPR